MTLIADLISHGHADIALWGQVIESCDDPKLELTDALDNVSASTIADLILQFLDDYKEAIQ